MGENALFWDSLLNNFQAYLMAFCRFTGIFVFNPVFARNNIPGKVKMGAAVSLSILTIGSVVKIDDFVNCKSVGELFIGIVGELFIGFVLGFVTVMFINALLWAGEIMDMQCGLGMAKVYDPANGVQMPLFGTVANYMFLLYFFVTNAHLSLIKIYTLSFELIPVGAAQINTNVGWILVSSFGAVLELALKLALPFMAAEFIVEMCVGILMKAVPQIQVMVVNIQVKLFFGLILLFLLAIPMSNFIEKYINNMVNTTAELLNVL